VVEAHARSDRDQCAAEHGATDGHEIKTIDAVHGNGTDKRPGRNVEYAAEAIHVTYNESHAIDKITGTGARGWWRTAPLRIQPSRATGWISASRSTRARIAVGRGCDRQGLSGIETDRRSERRDGGYEDHPVRGARSENAAGRQGTGAGEHPVGGTLEFLPNQNARHRRILKQSA